MCLERARVWVRLEDRPRECTQDICFSFKTRPLLSRSNPCTPQHLHFIITMVFVCAPASVRSLHLEQAQRKCQPSKSWRTLKYFIFIRSWTTYHIRLINFLYNVTWAAHMWLRADRTHWEALLPTAQTWSEEASFKNCKTQNKNLSFSIIIETSKEKTIWNACLYWSSCHQTGCEGRLPEVNIWLWCWAKMVSFSFFSIFNCLRHQKPN